MKFPNLALTAATIWRSTLLTSPPFSVSTHPSNMGHSFPPQGITVPSGPSLLAPLKEFPSHFQVSAWLFPPQGSLPEGSSTTHFFPLQRSSVPGVFLCLFIPCLPLSRMWIPPCLSIAAEGQYLGDAEQALHVCWMTGQMDGCLDGWIFGWLAGWLNSVYYNIQLDTRNKTIL